MDATPCRRTLGVTHCCARSSGVAPRPLHRRNLSVGKLTAAINTALDDEAMRQRAVEVGQDMEGEAGVAQAVELIGGLGL